MIKTIIPIIRGFWEPVSTDPAWQWIRDNVGLGQDSELKRFDFELCPMHKFFHDSVQSPLTRRVTEMVCAQSGKTKNALAAMIWRVRNQPRDAAWFTDTSEKAKADFKIKIWPFLRDCEALDMDLPKDRNRKSQRLIQFDSMALHILGAESKSNRESITLFSVFCDEVRNYKPGALTQIDNRLKTIRNSQRVVFSSAGDEFDELHRSFNEGTQHFFFWACPHCGHKQTFRFGRDATPLYPKPRDHGGFVWDSNEVTHPDDFTWNFPELAKTVRYECENAACKYRFHQSEKWQLMRTLEPIQTNPHADPTNISMHWWEAYMPWADCEWDRIVVKFLRAQLAARRGNFEPLRVIVCETFGEPWRPPGGHKIHAGEILKRCGEYAMREPWPEGTIKVLTVDVQQGYIYFTLRAWSTLGESRLIDCGIMPTFDDLRVYQIAAAVMDRLVFIDCAYEPGRVFEACLQHGRWVIDSAHPTGRAWDGWTPVRGDERETFVQKQDGDAITTHWRWLDQDAHAGKAGMPRIIRVYIFSKGFYRERLFLYACKGKLPWWLPKNIPDEYVKQMGNVERRELLDAQGQQEGWEWHEKGRHDYPDTEQMQLAVADFARIGI